MKKFFDTIFTSLLWLACTGVGLTVLVAALCFSAIAMLKGGRHE